MRPLRFYLLEVLQSAKLISVQVGKTRTYPAEGEKWPKWRSSIHKTGVSGPVWVGTNGLAGDSQTAKSVHGGPDKAANCYPSEHYPLWRQTPGLETMTGGAFGENFTTAGLLEDTVCIGDVFRAGDVVVQVSQPRGPCYKLNRRWNSEDLMDRAIDSGRVGWYFRILQEGRVEAGLPLELVEHPHPEWSIARVWALKRDGGSLDDLRALVELPALSEDWKISLRKKLG